MRLRMHVPFGVDTVEVEAETIEELMQAVGYVSDLDEAREGAPCRPFARSVKGNWYYGFRRESDGQEVTFGIHKEAGPHRLYRKRPSSAAYTGFMAPPFAAAERRQDSRRRGQHRDDYDDGFDSESAEDAAENPPQDSRGSRRGAAPPVTAEDVDPEHVGCMYYLFHHAAEVPDDVHLVNRRDASRNLYVAQFLGNADAWDVLMGSQRLALQMAQAVERATRIPLDPLAEHAEYVRRRADPGGRRRRMPQRRGAEGER